MVTKDQALEIARQELMKQGHLASDYEISVDVMTQEPRRQIIFGPKPKTFRREAPAPRRSLWNA
jgi:hypothetical protein